MRWLKKWSARLFSAKRSSKCTSEVPELIVEELHHTSEQGLDMRLSHPMFSVLANEIVQMFDGSGATNYVEYTIYSEKHGPMTVHIQRRYGETPAAQNIKLRARVAELEANMAKV